jgi:hypothetical protein
LYIVEKDTKKLTTYLEFNGRNGKPGLFHKLFNEAGYGCGLATLYFDPAYRTNGKFYTVHIEDPSIEGSNLPDNAAHPPENCRICGDSADQSPGAVLYEACSSSGRIATSQTRRSKELPGTAAHTAQHAHSSAGDLIFNPTARPGDADWRVLYIASGDGGSARPARACRLNPQRLDNLEGKILRSFRICPSTRYQQRKREWKIPHPERQSVRRAGRRP